MRRYLANVSEDFWYMLQARRPLLYRELLVTLNQPDVDKSRVMVTLGQRRAMISWPGAELSADDADRCVDRKYGDGLVVDVVSKISVDTFMAYWGLSHVCEVVDSKEKQDGET